ncbi:MAG: ABC transporter ATP-binding protein/permease [bacterium]|nr:ABC transporter ATP-binding protein/permease [bacterium]
MIISLCYLLMSALPYIQIRLVQSLIDHNDVEQKYLPYAVIIGLVLQQIAMGVTKGLIKYVSLKLKYAASLDLNENFYGKCDRLPYTAYENPTIVKNINIVRNHYENMCRSSIDGFFSILSTSLTLILILGIIRKAGFVVLLISVVTLVPVCIFSVKYSMKEMKGWDESGGLWEKACYYSHVITSREYAKESHVFQTNSFMQKKWKASFHEYHSQILKMTGSVRLKKAFFVFVQCLAIGVVISVLLPSLKNKSITIGCLVGTVEGLYQLTKNIGWDMAAAISNCAYSKKVYEIYQSVIDAGEQQYDENHVNWDAAYEEIKRNPVLEVKDVWFRYDLEKDYVLKGVNFRIDLGKKVLLVGENGSGKTTLIKLILGFYKPEKGYIKIGGYDIAKIPPDIRYKIFSAVFQDYAKFEISLSDNLEIGSHEKYDEKELLALFEKVDGTSIFNTISSINDTLGKKYEDGKDLSNGQWQKIALIRAIAKEYSLLIMDEPTAAQDPMAEVAIYRNLIGHMINKSGLLITHRLGAAKYCDSILVLKEGKISESGTHAELMNNRQDYWKMYHVQKEWYNESID